LLKNLTVSTADLFKPIMKSKRIVNITYMLAIVVFAVWSIIEKPTAANIALVLLIVFAATKRVSHFFMHWILVPANLIYNTPGSFFWERFSVRWSHALRLLVATCTSYILFDSTTFYIVTFILLSDSFSDFLLHARFAPLGVYGLLRWLFPSFERKYGMIWFLAFAAGLAYFFVGYRLVASMVETHLVVGIVLLISLLVFDFLRWIVAFASYVRSKKYLSELPVTALPSQSNLFIMLALSSLFMNTKGLGGWDGIMELVLFVIVYVADVVVLQSDIYSDAYKGRWSDLFDKPVFRYDAWFYWIVIHVGMVMNSFIVPTLVWFFVFFRREWNYLSNYLTSSKNHVLDGAVFTLFTNDYFPVESYEKFENKFGIQGYKTAFIFRSYFINGREVVSLNDILNQSKFSLLLVGMESGHRDLEMSLMTVSKLKTVVLGSIRTPYKVLSIVEYTSSKESLLDAKDARLIDRYACAKEEDYDFEHQKRVFGHLQFLYTYLDEQPQVEVKIIDEVSIDTLRLNDDLREFVQLRGLDISTCYDIGLTPLLILHRRTHEFSMVAGRFMELLNLIEVAARWIMILERPRIVNLSEEVQFSFGGVVSEIRATPFAEQVLFENADELAEYKKVLQTIFGYSQKENVRFRVIDFMNWVVFIRNKTRGHGSPSRVSLELYKLLELNTLRLLRSIAEYYDPEVLMCTADFYVVQRGMNFDFRYYDEQSLPEGISREGQKPFIRHTNSNGWYTSDELMTNKDNIYLLSAVKKGKCEWVCYNTGELIRPDVIVF